MSDYGYSVNNIISRARQNGVDFVESFALDVDNFLYSRENMSDETKNFMDKLLNFMDDVLLEASEDCECETGEW